MSSLNDTKSKYWKNGIDTKLAAILSDEDTIDRLLVNTDFDTLDMPEITTKPHLFNGNEPLVDITIVDDFNDSTLFMETLVEKTSPTTVEPITIADAMNEAKPVPVTKQSEPLSLPISNDKYDKSVIPVLGAAELKNPVETTVLIDGTKEVILHTPAATENEPFTSLVRDDNHDKSVISTLAAADHTNSVENKSSLVDNHTNVEKVAISSDFILNNFIANNPVAQTENIAPQPQRSDSDKRIQTSVTITSTINETVHDFEWTLFRTEQDKINAQYNKRITELERTLRKAMLFSLVAALLAGLSLIAVVSGLL